MSLKGQRKQIVITHIGTVDQIKSTHLLGNTMDIVYFIYTLQKSIAIDQNIC